LALLSRAYRSARLRACPLRAWSTAPAPALAMSSAPSRLLHHGRGAGHGRVLREEGGWLVTGRAPPSGRDAPELCRLVGSLFRNWVAEMIEFSERTQRDQAALWNRWGHGPPSPLMGVIPGPDLNARPDRARPHHANPDHRGVPRCGPRGHPGRDSPKRVRGQASEFWGHAVTACRSSHLCLVSPPGAIAPPRSPRDNRRSEGLARELAGAAPSRADDGGLLPLLGSEVNALQHLDIPRFVTSTTGTAVSDGDGEMVQSAVVAPGLDVAERRLDELDSSRLGDMQDQLASGLR
jgi:hypothetical protein